MRLAVADARRGARNRSWQASGLLELIERLEAGQLPALA